MPFKFPLFGLAKQFYELTTDGVIVADMSGIIRYANKSIYSLTNRMPESLLNKECESIQDKPVFNFKEIVHGLTVYQSMIEVVYCTRDDGTTVPLTACFSFLKYDRPDALGVLIVLRDKQTENQIDKDFFSQQSNLLRSLNFRTDEICLISDLQSRRHIYCSDTIEKILGWTALEYQNGGLAFGLSIMDLDSANKLTEQYKIELEKRQDASANLDLTPIVFEYRKRHKNGSWKWVRSESWILKRDEKGNILYILIFLKDITLLKVKSALELNSGVIELINNGLNHININGLQSEVIEHPSGALLLSSREKEILGFVKRGFSTKEIASKLKLTANTVNTYRKNLMNKLQAKNTAELVRIAMEQGID
ncbi:MAG: helix-turn-helix transcriptional regulator [Bacteroidia bacterium]|nr:helix-turn-helix transcriptional regulator [Bacteroidia bacterium]